MMTCIAIANTKGGSGKTTLTANLGAYLACCGWRVLLIDADIQPTLSNYFPIEANESGLTSMMTELNVNTSISRIPDQEMDIIYSDDPDGRLHEWIMRQPDGRLRIRAAVNLFRKHYDIVLIDTQGAAGPLLEAAVMAADVIVSPVPSEILSAREFIRGMNLVLEKVRPMLGFIGAAPPPLKAVLYRLDRTRDAGRIAEQFRMADFQDESGFTLLETWVPSAKAYRESATRQIPVYQLDGKRRGASPCGAEVMEGLARELLAGDTPASTQPKSAVA